MKIQALRLLISINNVLTTINGFIFGLLAGSSPLHPRNGKTRKIPFVANMALLVMLILVFIAEIR